MRYRLNSRAAALAVAFAWAMTGWAQEGDGVQPFAFPDGGGVHLETGGGGPVSVFHGVVEPTGGSVSPPGFAILGWRNAEGVLVTETTVQAAPAIRNGRVYAAYSEAVADTGIAIANPHDQEVTVDYFFTVPAENAQDSDFGHGALTIGPRQQTARTLSGDPFNLATGSRGTFSFSASLPVAATAQAWRGNERGEGIFHALPVIDLDAAHDANEVYVPHLATGGTWLTDFILVNPTDETMSGQLIFVSPGALNAENPAWDSPGLSASVSLNNLFVPAYTYAVGARGTFFYRTTLPRAFVETFSARARPAADSGATPTLHVTLTTLRIIEEEGRFRSDLISTAGFTAGRPDTAFRAYVETRGELEEPGAIRSLVALNNIEFERATIAAELRDLDGNLRATADFPVPPSGTRFVYVNYLFPDFDFGDAFRGVLRVSMAEPEPRNGGFTTLVLRSRWNERGELLITTTPAFAESEPSTADMRVLPHLLDGGGWTTEIVFFSGAAGQAAAGRIDLRDPAGAPADIID